MDIMEKHLELCKKIHQICVEKNKDYGDSVNDLYKKFGLISYVIRMNDKMNRINNLIKQGNLVKDEAIEDTLLDLANYCLLARASIELEKGSDKE